MMKLTLLEQMSNEVLLLMLEGNLNLEFEDQCIQAEFKGRSVTLLFSSFYALKKLLSLYRKMNKVSCFSVIQDSARYLSLTCYIDEFLIFESNPDFKQNWVGRYFGVERSKIFYSQFFLLFLKKIKQG